MGGLILADAAKQSMAKQAGSGTRVLLEIFLVAFFVQSALATSSLDEQLFRNADKGNLPAVVWDVARGADVNAHVAFGQTALYVASMRNEAHARELG